MAKNKDKQLPLIDVGPENLNKIMPFIEAYKDAQETRIAALADEVAAKKQILSLVREAGLKRLENGDIRFACDGFEVTITPADDKIKVKATKEE